MATTKKSLPILKLTAVEWECPHCHLGNAVPEVTECECGAVRVGNAAMTLGATPPATTTENTVTTTDIATSAAPAGDKG